MLILHTLDQGDSGGVWVVCRWLAGLWHTCEVYSYAPHGSSAGEEFKTAHPDCASGWRKRVRIRIEEHEALFLGGLVEPGQNKFLGDEPSTKEGAGVE